MKPEFKQGHVRANCPDCGAITTFEYMAQGNEYGGIVQEKSHSFAGTTYARTIYKLVRCASCGRGAIAEVHDSSGQYQKGVLGRLLPRTIDSLSLPSAVPDGIKREFQEAELCASVEAWRGGSALLRSTLEKTLSANGYKKGTLAERIDEAAADGAITAARSKRAHDDIRVLGNDILHDDWRAVTEDEFDQAHHYAQRILEDFYDDRPSVEALLIAKGRLRTP
jgi:hypothetical protein